MPFGGLVSIRRSKLLLLILVLAVAGCGSESTGHKSADAVVGTANSFAGRHAPVSTVNALWDDHGAGGLRLLRLSIVCKGKTRDCLLVAPDGAGYAGLEDLVDDTKLIKPGDSLSAAGGLPSKVDTAHMETYTKSDSLTAVWTVVAGVVAAVAVAFGAIMAFRRTRQRRENARLLDEWNLPPDGEGPAR